jgi:hypothetical protein
LILDEITKKLEQIDPIVFYGAVDSSVKETYWNYIVFDRTVMKPSANKSGYTDGYSVHIVRENFIPDGLAEEVIEKMLEIAGMRESGSDMQYQYMVKPNTDTVVEMLSIDFVKARKKA